MSVRFLCYIRNYLFLCSDSLDREKKQYICNVSAQILLLSDNLLLSSNEYFTGLKVRMS